MQKRLLCLAVDLGGNMLISPCHWQAGAAATTTVSHWWRCCGIAGHATVWLPVSHLPCAHACSVPAGIWRALTDCWLDRFRLALTNHKCPPHSLPFPLTPILPAIDLIRAAHTFSFPVKDLKWRCSWGPGEWGARHSSGRPVVNSIFGDLQFT